MKKFISLVLGAAVLATALAVCSPNEARGQSAGLVSSVLNKLERNHQTMKSLRAGITMEKYDSQLRDAERYYGVVIYVPAPGGRNDSVRIDWNKPQHETLAVSNGQYTLYKKRLAVAYRGNAKSHWNEAGNILSLIYLPRGELQRKFQIQDVREETLGGGVSTVHLSLVPKAAVDFKYAEIWVDSSGMPIQAKVVEKNDDATTVRLNNPEKNAKVSSDEFIVKLDPGVKIIKG
jgi:outer membrane lipoprotein-sorting protein